MDLKKQSHSARFTHIMLLQKFEGLGESMGFTLNHTVIAANTGKNSFSALDPKTLKRVSNIVGMPGSGPHGLTVCKNRQFLYAANSYDRTICAVDCLRGELSDSIPVGTTPCHLALCRPKSCLYVTNFDSDSIAVIGQQNFQQMLHIPVGRMPHDICFSPETGLLFVAESGENSIAVIDTEKNKKTGSISLRAAPLHMCLGRSGRYLYVAGSCYDRLVQGQIDIIDVRSQKEIRHYTVGNYLTDLCIDTGEETIFTADGGLGCFYSVDTETGNVKACMHTGFFPSCIGYLEKEKAVFVGDHMTGEIAKYDLRLMRKMKKIEGFVDVNHMIVV